MVLSAKITPPHIDECIQRRDLYARLDSVGARPVTWISAPPGAGKTILVASYLQQKRRRPLWYQIDGHDAEPATFFHYLALAAGAASHKGVNLPPLTAEYAGGVDVFARNYFALLCEQISQPTLVFDDFQNLPESVPTQEIIAGVLAGIPRDIRVFIVSRSAPAGPFSRLLANGVIALIKPDELLFSKNEVSGLLDLKEGGDQSEGRVEAVYQLTKGWAAGCVLALEASHNSPSAIDEIAIEQPKAMFDYFALEVVGRLDIDTRDVLLKTSFLPSVTPARATALTNNQNVKEIFERLVRENHFTLKRSATQPIYAFHPLFSDFLRQHAQSHLDAELLDLIKRRSAELLVKDGQIDAAVDLWRQVEDWSQIEKAVLENVNALLASGRNDTLRDWIGYLPRSIYAERPWLRLWNGIACLTIDPIEAHSELAHAWHQFRDAEESEGALMAWAGIVDCYNFRQDYSDFNDWIVALEELLGDGPRFPSEMAEASVTAALAGNAWMSWPDHPSRENWESRAEQLTGSLHPNRRVQAMSLYALRHLWTGEVAKAAVIVDEILSFSEGADILPLMRLNSYMINTVYYGFTGNWEEAATTVSSGLAVSEQFGIRVFDALLHGWGIVSALAAGEIASARDHLELMLRIVQPERLWEYGFYHVLAAWYALSEQDYLKAAEHQRRAEDVCIKSGSKMIVSVAHLFGAIINHELGEPRAAEKHLESSLQIARIANSPSTQLMCHLTAAEWALERGDHPGTEDALSKGLCLIRDLQISVVFGWRRENLARLFSFALDRGIEEETVQASIEKLHLTPPSQQLVSMKWPRPLHIRVLGSFNLRLRGGPVEFTGKTQRRPIDLLKALIAFGGDQVQEWVLADALWPDSEGAASAQALATTLHRLRKILGDSRFVDRQNGTLTLKRELCWVDLFELEGMLAEVQRPLASAGAGAAENNDRSAERVLELYKPFLGQEDTPWAFDCRERLRRRVLAALRAWAEERAQKGHYDRAIPIYEGAIEIDNLAEDNYRGLMRCLANVGRSAEALALYQKCRGALRDTLGAGPSNETTALYRSIQSETPTV